MASPRSAGFEDARLGVEPVEDGHVARDGAPFAEERGQVGGDGVGLFLLVAEPQQPHRLALGILRPERLRFPLDVVGDEAVRGLEDALRAAVVLLQAHDAGVGIVALELEDVVHVGAAPAVDGLVRIAGDAQVPGAGQVLGDQVLRVVGVLVLVHEHVQEPAAEPLARLGDLAEQADHEDEQVVEIGGVGAAEQPLVALEDLADGEGLLRRAGLLEFLGSPEPVLGGADHARGVRGREERAVELKLGHRALDGRDRVGAVVDGEGAAQADAVGVDAQHPGAEGVERGDPDARRHAERLDPLAHFAGGLVGEGDREDVVGPAARRDEVRHAARDDARLSRCPARPAPAAGRLRC